MPSLDQLEPGTVKELLVTVDETHITSHTGTPILTTPEMIRLMERVSTQLVQPLLPPGYTTVGFEVHVKHRAPAPLGSTVRVWSCLKEIDETRLGFEVRVSLDEKLIGEGSHRRTVIPRRSSG